MLLTLFFVEITSVCQAFQHNWLHQDFLWKKHLEDSHYLRSKVVLYRLARKNLLSFLFFEQLFENVDFVMHFVDYGCLKLQRGIPIQKIEHECQKYRERAFTNLLQIRFPSKM